MSDKAGNEGTSSKSTVTVSSNGTWTWSDATRGVDALAGDSLLQQGNLNLVHALDLDESPGTEKSLHPVLSYNSNRVDVKPIISGTLQTVNNAALPSTVTAELFWNGSSQGTTQYSTTGIDKGELLTIAQQVSSAVGTTGRYLWQLDVTLDYATPVTHSIYGASFVVAEDGSAFGAGWTFGPMDRLVSISQQQQGTPSGTITYKAGKLRVYGTTGHGFYEEDGSGGYNSPKGDNGTLSSISGGFKYVTPEASERHFNSNGYQTKIQSPDGFEVVTFTLNGSNDVSKMETADGAVNTFTYSGGVLAKIETGSRTVTLTHSTGDLTKVENPDNGVRSFTYNASSKLTDDAFDIILGSYGYDSGVLNAWTSGDATASEDVETTLEPLLLKGLGSLVAGEQHSPCHRAQ